MKKNAPDKQSFLRDIEIFKDLSEEEVDALSEKMPLKNVAAKTILYTPEEATEVLFMIKKGRVRLFRLTADGKAFTTAILEKGTFFGQLALLGQQLYGNFAEALTDCVICFISRADAKTYLIGDARIAYRVIETLGRRLLEIEPRLADAALKHVPARVASLLLQIAEKQVREGGANHPATDAIEINFTHEELAQLLGIHRETISRTLKEFSRLDLIRLGRGRIALLDAKGLLDLSAV